MDNQHLQKTPSEPDVPPLTWAERRAELVHYLGLTDWQVALCAGLPTLLFIALLLLRGEGRGSGFAILITYLPIPGLVLACQLLSRRFGPARFLAGTLAAAGLKMILTASFYVFFVLRRL
jgi:hypothetical protein